MNQLIAPLFYSRLKEPKFGKVFYFNEIFTLFSSTESRYPAPVTATPVTDSPKTASVKKKQASASEDAEAGSYLWLRKSKKSGWGLGWGRIRTKMGRRVESLREREKVQPPIFCSSTRTDKKITRTQKNRHPGNWSPAAGTRLISDENLSP